MRKQAGLRCLPVWRRMVQGCRKIENLFKSLLGCNLNPYASYLKRSSSGFTSIELVMVILCLGILTFAIGVRYNRSEIGSAIAADQLIADIRYVQLKAISIGQPYKITFSGNSYSMSRTDNIESETKKLPNDEAATTDFGNTLIFNTLGEPYNASSVFLSPYGQIQLSGGNLVKVYDITGKAE
jgi:hypothetical protein